MFKIAKNIKIGIKLDKSGFQKELNQLLSKGYDLNLNNGNFKSVVNDITKELDKLKTTLNSVNSGDSFSTTANSAKTAKTEVENLANSMSKIDKLKYNLQLKLDTASANNLIDTSVIDNLQQKLNSINSNTAEREILELKTAINNLSSADSGIVRVQQAIVKLQERISTIKANNIDIINQGEIAELKAAENEVGNLKTMLGQLQTGDVINGKKISSSINTATNSVRALESSFKSANTTASSLAITMKNIFSYAIGGSAIYAGISSIREAVSVTRELDSAMTDLKKVTDETSETYTSFLSNMHNVALELGTQSNAMVDATTNWAKTGKNLQEAAELAENTVLLTKVGDVDNVDTAQTYMLPALQAFNIEAEKSITLIDKYNNISNNMATTVNDVGDAMSKSASSMSVAGNSLEQTIALIATAESQTKLGGAEVGTALKTLSMRLATFKDDETGEVIPQMAEKIKELSDVDITDVNGQLKNTYDIYTEIGKVYKDLDKNTQLQLNEILGGKMRGNIVSAILTNVDELQRAYDLANNSAGSAMNEFEKYQDSIQYSVDRLKEQINGLYTSFMGSDFLKGLTEGAVGVIGTIQKISDTFGSIPTAITAVVGALTIFNKSFRQNAQILTSAIPLTSKWQAGLLSAQSSLKTQITSIKANITQLKSYSLQYSEAGLSTKGFGKNLLSLNGQLALTTAGMIASKVAAIALNAAMSMALTLGISTIISGLGSLIDKLVLTRSELNELNQEFVTTNSDSEMSNVIDLVNTYEELEDKLSTLSKGTSEYQAVEEKLASTQESILSVYPSASKAIEYNTEAKRLNLEATKKLIDKDLELAKADALNILEKNDTKSDTGLDKAIEEYQEYYKVLEKVNDLAEKEETKSVNIESDLSKSGELLVNAKDVNTYKKRVESLNDTLEASYEAYKILGVSNDKYAEKAKKVGEALGYSASQTEELINKLKETDESADETAESLTDINGDGIIDATDEMLSLAMATDEAKSAIENLADSFDNFQTSIELLRQMKEEYEEFGMLDSGTMSKVLSTGDSQLIALLGDEANFIENINSLLDEKVKNQDKVLAQTIAMAQAEVNGSQEVVDATNAEAQAIANLENTKANITNQSVMTRANAEASLVDNNTKNYNADESNFVNKENYKIKGAFTSANQRIKNESEVTTANSKNYSTDDSNHVSLLNSKIKGSDSFTNAVLDNNATWVNNSSDSYSKDAQNYANYISSKLQAYREYLRVQKGGLIGGASSNIQEELAQIEKWKKEYDAIINSITNVESKYVNSGSVSSGGVSHGNIGSSGSSSGSSSSTDKEIADIQVTADWYIKLNNAIDDNNRLLEENRNAQVHASGTDLIRLMKQEVELMNRQVKAQQDLLNAKRVAANQSADYLRSKGIEIDANDNLVNATDRLIEMKRRANTLSGDAKAAAIAEIETLNNSVNML